MKWDGRREIKRGRSSFLLIVVARGSIDYACGAFPMDGDRQTIPARKTSRINYYFFIYPRLECSTSFFVLASPVLFEDSTWDFSHHKMISFRLVSTITCISYISLLLSVFLSLRRVRVCSVYLLCLLANIRRNFDCVRAYACNGAGNLCQASSTVKQSYATEREIYDKNTCARDQFQSCWKQLAAVQRYTLVNIGEMCDKTIIIISVMTFHDSLRAVWMLNRLAVTMVLMGLGTLTTPATSGDSIEECIVSWK